MGIDIAHRITGAQK